MSAPLALSLIALVEFTSIILLAKLPIRFVCGSIAVNLNLISVYGSTLVDIFGFITNAGNIFYVAATFTFYILLEKYGRRIAYKAIQSSVFLVLLFVVCSELITAISGIETQLQISPRLAFASLLAFFIAQHINLRVYERLFMRFGETLLWLRVNLANLITQVADSVIFFTLAFYGTAPDSSVWEIMLVGFGLKAVAGILGTILLYTDRTVFRHTLP